MPELAQPYVIRSARRIGNEVRTWEIAAVRPEPPASTAKPDTAALYQEAVREAESLLADARLAVQQLRESALRELELEAERVLAKAHAEGMEAGLNEGRAQLQSECQSQLEPLQALLTELPAAWNQFCHKQIPTMTEICIKAAESILHEQLTLEPERVAAIVRAAISHVPHGHELTVAVHPEDLPLLQLETLTTRSTDHVQLTPDPTLRRGGCRVESRQGVVDATTEGAMHRLARTLREERAV